MQRSENREHRPRPRGKLDVMELLDRKTYYRAFETRDVRFDGHVFVGVTSTRI